MQTDGDSPALAFLGQDQFCRYGLQFAVLLDELALLLLQLTLSLLAKCIVPHRTDGDLTLLAFHRAEADLGRELAAVLADRQQIQSATHRSGPRILRVGSHVLAMFVIESMRDEGIDRSSNQLA